MRLSVALSFRNKHIGIQRSSEDLEANSPASLYLFGRGCGSHLAVGELRGIGLARSGVAPVSTPSPSGQCPLAHRFFWAATGAREVAAVSPPLPSASSGSCQIRPFRNRQGSGGCAKRPAATS